MTNTRKPIVGGFAIGILVLSIFFSGCDSDGPPPQPLEMMFPWQIEVRPDGLSRVFGITLGETTLGSVQARFRDDGDIKMFVSSEKASGIEVFFKSVALKGIHGKIVLGLEPGDEIMADMLARGTRIKPMSSGEQQVTLHPEDLAYLQSVPISTITYIPSINLDKPMIRYRFGEPEKRIPEQEQVGVVHWLYPHLGLDVVLNEDGKEVLQYVAPRQSQRLLEGL